MSRIPTRIHPYLSRAYGRLPPLERYSNYCLDFDQVTGHTIAVPLSADFNMFGVDFSIIIWLNPRDIVTVWQKVMSPTVYPSNMFLIHVHPNQIYAYMAKADATSATLWSGAPLLVPYRWYQLVITYNSATQTSRLYLNARLRDTDVNLGGDYNVNVGIRFGGAAPTINGRLNEIQILKGKLMTPQEIQESFYRGYALREAASVLNLRLEEGTGLTAYDESGHGNNGTLGPAPVWTEVMKHELLADARI